MLQYTWKPRNAYLDGTSVITLESLTGTPIEMPAPPVVSNRNITVTVPAEGNYVVKVKTKNIAYAYRITANDTSNDITPGASVGPSTPKTISVVTGNESRPAGSEIVFWVGGSSAPANMQNNDLWFSSGPVEYVDTVDPSAPTGLAASLISGSGFTLSWSAATDNVGVTGYDIFLNGSAHSSTTGLTAALTGLAASTQYSVAVRAKDAAGNLSALSTPLSVTTVAANASVRHSIWGSSPYPYAASKYTESLPITLANSFYSYGTSPDVSAWRLVGAKVWVPAGVSLQAGTIMAWAGSGVMIDSAPAQSKAVTSWVAGAWNEVIFDTPIETNAGESVWVGYKLGNSGEYLAATAASVGNNFVTATDGSHIVLSDDNGSSMRRSQILISGSPVAYVDPNAYSIDAIYDEGP